MLVKNVDYINGNIYLTYLFIKFIIPTFVVYNEII